MTVNCFNAKWVACRILFYVGAWTMIWVAAFVWGINPYMAVHTATCQVTEFQATQIPYSENNGCDYTSPHADHCDKCAPLFADCCNPPKVMADTVCFDLQVEFAVNTSGSRPTRAIARLDCGTDLEKQANYRSLLYPNASFPCYWSRFRPQWSPDKPPTTTDGTRTVLAFAILIGLAVV